MKQLIKNLIKKNIPSRYIELITSKGITLTKIPKGAAVISDLFLLRVEEGWETYFECLQFQSLLNAEVNEYTKEFISSLQSKRRLHWRKTSQC